MMLIVAQIWLHYVNEVFLNNWSESLSEGYLLYSIVGI